MWRKRQARHRASPANLKLSYPHPDVAPLAHPTHLALAKEQNRNIVPAMVARSYLGLLAPEQDFERLRTYRDQLLTMAQAYRPGGAEYMALSRAVMALDEAAGIVMNKPSFYQGRLHKTT
jgi:hypothetical protein